VPEVRRLLQALGADTEQRSFLVSWSRWRRAHQAGANRCHCTRHVRRRAVHALPGAIPIDAGDLSDGAWQQLQPLLPPQRPRTGRPRYDHRTVLGGILWVFRTASPWREMPARFGKWDTAYARYRLWLAEGRWQRIVDALGQGVPPATPP
jgi:hypothetical protein